METILEVLLGIGLSASAGFRIFVPMFVMSLAAQWGHLTLAPGFQWLATPAATIVLGLAIEAVTTGGMAYAFGIRSLAGAILATSTLYAVMAQVLTTDMLLAATVTAAPRSTISPRASCNRANWCWTRWVPANTPSR